MENKVMPQYQTSDGRFFEKKEDADQYELNWALQQVLKEEIHAGFEDIAKVLCNHFDIHFKGEIVRLNTPKFVPGDYVPMQHHATRVPSPLEVSYAANLTSSLRDEIKAMKELLAKKEDIINRLHNQIHNLLTGGLDD